MSYTLLNVFGSLPRTTRGASTPLGADPKGKSFLYVNGNSVFIRSIDDPLVCDVYTEHSLPVQCAKYSPSGFYIASADQSGKVRIWDTTNKEHILKNEFQPIAGIIKDLQWSGDNQRIIVGGEGREKFGHVFNADTGTSVGEIMGTSKPINSVDFKPSRPFRAVVASEDNSICYFEGPPFKWKRTLNEHDRFVNVIRYSPNGERFASGGADGKLVIFDGKTGDKQFEIKNPSTQTAAHVGGIYALCWDPSSQMILTCSGDKTAKVWRVEGQSLVKEFKFGESVDDQQVGCLWQDKHLLSVSLSGCINYLSLDADAPVKVIKGHTKSITALEVVHGTADGTVIFSGSHDGLLIHWQSDTGKMDAVKPGATSVGAHKNQVQAMRFDAGTNSLVTVGLDDTIKFVDVAQFTYAKEFTLDSQPQQLDTNDQGVVVVACINKLSLFVKKDRVADLNLSYEATSVSLSKTRNHVAVGGKDNKVHIYELDLHANQFKELIALSERDFITAVRYSHDEEYLAVADNAKNVKCYKIDRSASPTVASSYAEITRDMWQHHAGRITSLAWSPDSTHLATASVDTHCFIYSPSKISGFIQIKNAHPLNPLSSCAWLDNNHLVTSSQDCCLRKWKINY